MSWPDWGSDPGPTFHRWIRVRLFIDGFRSDFSFSWVQIRLFIFVGPDPTFHRWIQIRHFILWVQILDQDSYNFELFFNYSKSQLEKNFTFRRFSIMRQNMLLRREQNIFINNFFSSLF